MKRKKDNLVKKARVLMKQRKLAGELVEVIETERGRLGFLLAMLKNRPAMFNPYVLKGFAVYRPEALDGKTAELAAVASAAALRCEHCLDAHIDRAVREGASMEEIMDTLLIAGAISESSTLSVAFRKFKQKEGKLDRKK